MSPAAKPENLLYVSNNVGGTVDVYAWGHNEQVGVLTGFTNPAGVCVDKEGDVFITDVGVSQIVEYAHGGGTPIATLNDPGYYPGDCSVDRTTGNLAVANGISISGEAGNVAIYQNASGSPTLMTAPNFYAYQRCGYDDSGNLYVGGDTSSANALFAELRQGSSAFADISLNQTIDSIDGVKWDGEYLDVGDEATDSVYQFAVSGSAGTLQGTIPLNGATGLVSSFWIPKFGNGRFDPQGKHIVASSYGYSNGAVEDWAYPGGGTPTKMIDDGDSPVGVTVSESKR
jgi:hypothetical protein